MGSCRDYIGAIVVCNLLDPPRYPGAIAAGSRTYPYNAKPVNFLGLEGYHYLYKALSTQGCPVDKMKAKASSLKKSITAAGPHGNQSIKVRE